VAERDHTPWPAQPGHYGAAGTGVAFEEGRIAAAWNVQGDPGRAPFVDEGQRLSGVALPLAPNTIAQTEAATVLWLGPMSWLLLARGATRFGDFDGKRDAMNAAGGALFDLSASRIAWTISGPDTATVLSKSCPLDFHPRAFPPGTCAQSLLGHVNAFFVNDAGAFRVMVARSFARHAWYALCESAAQYGYEVRPPAPYR
jgi:sarcosine oxidase, subunit gamma